MIDDADEDIGGGDVDDERGLMECTRKFFLLKLKALLSKDDTSRHYYIVCLLYSKISIVSKLSFPYLRGKLTNKVTK